TRSARLAAAAIVLALGAGLAWMALATREPPASAPDGDSLAVLPFQQLGPASGNEYIGIGMADSLISRLGQLRNLAVRPLQSVQRYADGRKDPQTAGRELRVQSVLDGSVQRDGDRLRVRVRLYRVSDASVVWADQFDQQAHGLFA